MYLTLYKEDSEMENTDKIKMLQTIYAGSLADHVLRLGNEGVLKKVTDQKKLNR
jgi:hypothetical protein